MERPVIVPPQAAAPRHRKGVWPLDPTDRTEKDRKMKVEEKRKPDREVSQKIAEVLAAARQRNEKLSPRQELKRRAEQALKAAKYRGASPESRKRYELEKTFEDRATKALSEARARATCTVSSNAQPSGVLESEWGHHEEDHLPWDQEETEEFVNAWSMEEQEGSQEAYLNKDYGYDSYDIWDPYGQDASAASWSYEETSHVVSETSHSWAGQGYETTMPQAQDRSFGRWGFAAPVSKPRFLQPARTEETEVLRACAETTTAASSTRSVASAADSNSETGPVNDAHDDDDADELLASCWKAVAEAAEV